VSSDKHSEIQTTQQELFKQYLDDEQLKIDELDWHARPEESQRVLVGRLEALEAILFEAKARATKVREVLSTLPPYSRTQR